MNIEQMKLPEPDIAEGSTLYVDAYSSDSVYSILAARDAQWAAAQQRVLAEQAEPVAWMEDVKLEMHAILNGRPVDAADHARRALIWIENASPPVPQEAQADSTPLLPVARIRSWTKHGEGHGDLVDWLEGSENLPDGEYDLYLGPQSEQKPVASIYISPNGEREFDDWKHDLPIGRNELFAAPVAQPATEQAEAPSDEREEIEAVIACLGDDAAQLRDENPEDERADNMDRAATLLERLIATQPTASNAGEQEALDVIDAFEAEHDGFHLSAEDYAEWFKKLRAALANKPAEPVAPPAREALPQKDQRITLLWQGRVDGTVEAFEINGMLVIPDAEGVTYLTREQAVEFFGATLSATPPAQAVQDKKGGV